MSKSTKDVKIGFHTIIQNHYKEPEELNRRQNPFFDVIEVLTFVSKLSKVKRFYNLQDDKFCFIDNVDTTFKDGISFTTGFVKSARNQFRPNLIDKRTGNERPNPKALTEGDIEKTHFCIRIDQQEVMLFLQNNFHGISTRSLINYLKHFEGIRLGKLKQSMTFSLDFADILRNDFLTELENMKRVKTTEIFVDKKLLGSNTLNLSERIVSVQNDIKVVVTAKTRENIKNLTVDVFNVLNGGKSQITKIRAIGNDVGNNDVIIDTSNLNRVEFVNVDLNPETGEVNTTQMITGLKRIANSY